MLENVEWGEFKIRDLFEVTGTKSFDSNAIEFVAEGINFVGRSYGNNGIQGKIEKQSFEPNAPDTITATVIGNYKYVKLQKEQYYCSQNINKLSPRAIITNWNQRVGYFFISHIQKFVSLYDNQQGGYKLEDIKNHKIQIPVITEGKPDFDFMESFITELEAERITELEAYLSVTGLKDYELTTEEQIALLKFNKDEIQWGEFTFNNIFNNISQGRRLKKDDQISGDIPFVMAGITNNGVVNYISNPVATFPSNAITIDIFGNTFYRNYNFGAGDDTGVYWSTDTNYSYLNMLFYKTSMEKSVYGKFDYGNKLRSSQSYEFKMRLPTKNKKPDYTSMDTFISAIQKLVIKDVVQYSEKKVKLHSQIINKDI